MADEITAPSDASSMSEFKSSSAVQAILSGVPTPAVVKEPPAESTDENVDASQDGTKPESVIAPDSEPGESRNQETGKKDRSAAGRIAQLHAEAKSEREARQKLEAEIAELRKGTRKPEETKTVEPPKPEAKADGKPKLAEFTADSKYKTYDEAQEAWADARDEWVKSQSLAESRKAEEQKSQQQRQVEHQGKLLYARAKYADFDAKLQAGIAATAGVENRGIEAAIQEIGKEAFAEVLYGLVDNLDEYRRIAALPPQQAYREILKLELKLSSGEDTPERTVKPISKAPAPPETIGGNGAVLGKDPSKAGSMRDFKSNPKIQALLK